ncbi:hypothetical protein CSA37_03755 [Candidatus Fermentibacteria bacterium]|nr:MAG: hypothetical protein CSA37_03755 [Candidatus Fermentibacteria bacterium]
MIWQCIPEPVERIWGALPPVREEGEPIGEIWLFSDGNFAVNPSGEKRLLNSFFGGRVPVILKTLHASRDLSVQVHPGLDGSDPRKDESWAVLSGCGRIYHGIKDGASPDRFAAAVRDGTVEKLLLNYSAKPGDLFHLPAGTVHALGGGLTVLEAQLNCTVTYRLWDYGRPRELHVEQGLQVINWSNQGRAEKVTELPLGTGDYAIRKAVFGTNQMDSMEIAYDHHTGKCFFFPEGGSVLLSGESWIVRIL